MRLLMPIVLIIAAIGLFVVYTNPAYQDTKQLALQAAAYDDALNKSQELKATRDALLSKRNTFKAEDVQKLEHVLPDNVDNIRLIIDINNIASRHGLTLSNVQIGSVSGSKQQSAFAVTNTADPVGSVSVGFAITASYDDFLAFLSDLEHSLRVVDVEKISFSSAGDKTTTFSLSIRTYWLH